MKSLLLVCVIAVTMLFGNVVYAAKANLSGVWRGNFYYEVEMVLKQKGKKIKGSATGTNSSGIIISIKGTIVDDEINLIVKTVGEDCLVEYEGVLDGDLLELTPVSQDGSDCGYEDTVFARIYTCK
jgi:hypothetical protein